ncbi:transcription factor E4F1 isoform X3 [Anolis sagrei]|uniref:transcription factor E4F1 isoform X3 n=1 Tax=Anolis sagrei TaxID=38937 RepID=UPI0035200014
MPPLDKDDRHKCGRCGSEFTSLEEFVQHKLQKLCQRQQNAADTAVTTTSVISSVEEPITIAHIVVEASPITEEISNASSIVEGGVIKEVIVADSQVFESPNGQIDGSGLAEEQCSPKGPEEEEEEEDRPGSVDLVKVKLLVNKEGRYVCELCHKTFKTASILKAHMITHSSRKDYECKLCGTSFRTKGSLIRHHRRHTDERPYKCKKCGKSFRESGALTRHQKSLTPCTEKIRFSLNKEILISKEDLAAEPMSPTTEAVPSLPTPPAEPSPVIHLVTDAKGNVLHEVHVRMQELPKALGQETSNSEELPLDTEENENLLREAMRNSGIVIERVSVEERANSDAVDATSAAEEPKGKEASGKLCGEQFVEIEEAKTPEADVTEEGKGHACPYCSETFRERSSLDLHISGHLDYKPFSCEECGKEFTKGYLLKKHQEVHVNQRRFRCGECGKLYKTIAHVKGHRRVHSDERPYPCAKCGKRFKTKNAQQVHFRTHLEEKPYVCQFCSQGFREKGSLVRHIRHHTGEKPFKCYRCGRGFAEHGTLNRHLRTIGGCLLALKEAEEAVVSEEGQSTERLAATVISEDPPTVLVEFSSVVADTQEYIIETATEDMETSEATEIIEGTRHETLGLVINREKSQLTPTQRIHFIGAIIDSITQKAFLPENRFTNLRTAISKLQHSRSASAWAIQPILGHMSSTTNVTPFARLRMRPLQNWFIRTFNPLTDPQSRVLYPPNSILQSLSWWTREHNVCQGMPFNQPRPSMSLTTDASNSGWGAHLKGFKVSGHWSPLERKLHINALELIAVEKALWSFCRIIANRTIQIVTDNTAVKYYLNKQEGHAHKPYSLSPYASVNGASKTMYSSRPSTYQARTTH